MLSLTRTSLSALKDFYIECIPVILLHNALSFSQARGSWPPSDQTKAAKLVANVVAGGSDDDIFPSLYPSEQ